MIVHPKDYIDKYRAKGFWDDLTLIERFERNARINGKRVALVDPPNKKELVGFEQERVSYDELSDMVDRLASYLLDVGVFKDDCILVQLPNTVELIVTYLAAWRVSAFISPVPMQWREHELAQACRILEPKVFIVADSFKGFNHAELGKKLQNMFPSIRHIITFSKLHEISKNYRIREDVDEASSYLNPNDIAVIQWTSGTEVDPKACPLTHNNWSYLRFLYDSRYKGGLLKDGDVIMNPAPIVNMTGIGVGLVPWIMCSGTFVLHHPFYPEIFAKQLLEENVNFTLAVPAVVVALLKHPIASGLKFEKLRYFAQGSAAPPPWTFVELKKRNVEPINIWGQNEGTGLFSYSETVPDLEMRAKAFPIPNPDTSSLPYLQGIEIKIVDENGNEIKEPGKIGELCFKSPGTMACYFRQPEMTRRAFDGDGFFHTGDLFQLIDNNLVAFYDRKKDIIKRGGYTISSAEVENLVKMHPAILDVAAIGVPDERLGERIGVFVVLKPGASITLEDIKKHMEQTGVAIYKWPEVIIPIQEIPRNPVGKVQKTLLRQELSKRLKSEIPQ
ncbi:MAG: class I adenylate-forming enzyme family protein [Thermoprotei archaeon]